MSAYGELFERHVQAARRLARQLVSHGDVDDLVSDAFAKVLAVLQRGGGPDLAFRAYLLTAVRRLHVDKIRATSRLTTTDDMEAFDPGVPFRDTAVEGFENAAAAKAFASLPERWQLVLWHTEVEGAKPADVALLLGMSPNSVSALAYRAREGLRQAFLNMHVQELEEDSCKWTHQHVGAYVRKAVSKRDAGKVEAHLDECRKCMAIYLELSEVNSNLSGILAPLLLGSAGAAYVAATAGVAAKAGLLGALGRGRDFVLGRSGDAAAGTRRRSSHGHRRHRRHGRHRWHGRHGRRGQRRRRGHRCGRGSSDRDRGDRPWSLRWRRGPQLRERESGELDAVPGSPSDRAARPTAPPRATRLSPPAAISRRAPPATYPPKHQRTLQRIRPRIRQRTVRPGPPRSRPTSRPNPRAGRAVVLPRARTRCRTATADPSLWTCSPTTVAAT